MCRRKCLQGLCCASFGLGLMAGYSLDNWLVCSLGGLVLVVVGLLLAGRK